jgi:hypothetical protein
MMGKGKVLFESLFDLSFKTLVTPRVIKVLYALSIVAAGFLSIVLIIGGAHRRLTAPAPTTTEGRVARYPAPMASRNRSASMAARHPQPAAVTAWR